MLDALFDALLFQALHGIVGCITELCVATLWCDNVSITRCHMSCHAFIHISAGALIRLLIYVSVTMEALGCAFDWPKLTLLVLTSYSIIRPFATIYRWHRFSLQWHWWFFGDFVTVFNSRGLYCYLAQRSVYI